MLHSRASQKVKEGPSLTKPFLRIPVCQKMKTCNNRIICEYVFLIFIVNRLTFSPLLV